MRTRIIHSHGSLFWTYRAANSSIFIVVCPSQEYIFTGSIVPILSKLLAAGGMRSVGEREVKPYSVVRVETSKMANALADAENEAPPSDSEDELDEEPNKPEMVVAEPLVGGKEDAGKGVARKMAGKIGSSVFRGIITKVSSHLSFLLVSPAVAFPGV